MKPEFIQAVEDKDIYTIRSYITSEIIEDPTFCRNNLKECMDFIYKNGVDIFEKYEPTACETDVPDDISKWNRDLFYNKVEDLLHNFAFNERIVDIKKIGRHVYQHSFQEAPEIHRSGKKIKWIPITVGAAIALAVVTLVIVIAAK